MAERPRSQGRSVEPVGHIAGRLPAVERRTAPQPPQR